MLFKVVNKIGQIVKKKYGFKRKRAMRKKTLTRKKRCLNLWLCEQKTSQYAIAQRRIRLFA